MWARTSYRTSSGGSGWKGKTGALVATAALAVGAGFLAKRLLSRRGNQTIYDEDIPGGPPPNRLLGQPLSNESAASASEVLRKAGESQGLGYQAGSGYGEVAAGERDLRDERLRKGEYWWQRDTTDHRSPSDQPNQSTRY